MDGGPYRTPQPAARGVVGRQEPTGRLPEAQTSVNVEPSTTPRMSSPRAPKEAKSFKRFGLPFIIIVAILAISVAGWFVWSNMQNAGTAIDKSKYQAVFFTNGQVYFGKLQPVNGDYLQLTDIYYLQTQAGETTDPNNPQATSTDQSNIQLIKLGDEVHGPEDKMIISKDQVLFYENLKTDGKVAQSIDKFKKP